VRNLGAELPTASSICVAGGNYPEDMLVTVTRPTGTVTKNSVYKFDMRNMNKESLRAYYTTHELVPGDEYSSMSRVYDGFETGELRQYTTTNPSYNELKTDLEEGGSPSPTGYRVPNLREGVIMHLYCAKDAAWWDGNKGTLVNNFYSFGYHGNRYDVVNNEQFYSWSIYNDRVTLGNPGSQYIRFVKDINP
jgi:hypothetical protein